MQLFIFNWKAKKRKFSIEDQKKKPIRLTVVISAYISYDRACDLIWNWYVILRHNMSSAVWNETLINNIKSFTVSLFHKDLERKLSFPLSLMKKLHYYVAYTNKKKLGNLGLTNSSGAIISKGRLFWNMYHSRGVFLMAPRMGVESVKL